MFIWPQDFPRSALLMKVTMSTNMQSQPMGADEAPTRQGSHSVPANAGGVMQTGQGEWHYQKATTPDGSASFQGPLRPILAVLGANGSGIGVIASYALYRSWFSDEPISPDACDMRLAVTIRPLHARPVAWTVTGAIDAPNCLAIL